MLNEVEYVELGLSCADVCLALDQGMKGVGVDQPSPSTLGAIKQLSAWVKPTTRTPPNSLTK